MKNAPKRKAIYVRLIDVNGNLDPEPLLVVEKGTVGFRVAGKVTMFLWTDKGKTWLPVEG